MNNQKHKCPLTEILLILMLFSFAPIFSNENLYPLITNVPNRNTVTLNGQWDYIIDPYGTGYYNYRLGADPNGFFRDRQPVNESDLVEYNFERSPDMFIPHDWNTWNSELKYYEGIVWFRKAFDFKKKSDKRYFLYFGAVNYRANVYLNGEYLGYHKGGFTPFNFEITDKIQPGKNQVVVMVDNTRSPDEVPTVNTDWWNYGGITRDVCIIEEPETFISDFYIGLSKHKTNEISGWIRLSGPDLQLPATIDIPELKASVKVVPGENGVADFTLRAKPELWSPDHPRLYKVKFSTEDSEMHDFIAFRHIEAVEIGRAHV